MFPEMSEEMSNIFCATVDALVRSKLDTPTDNGKLTYFDTALKLKTKTCGVTNTSRPAMKCSVEGREFYLAQKVTPIKGPAECDLYVYKIPKKVKKEDGKNVYVEDVVFLGKIPLLIYQSLLPLV